MNRDQFFFYHFNSGSLVHNYQTRHASFASLSIICIGNSMICSDIWHKKPCVCYSRLGCSKRGLTLNGCSYLENCLKKRKRDDYPRRLGWSGLKSLTRFGHSLFFSSVKKTKGSSAYSGSTYLLGASERCNAGFKDFMTLTWPWLFRMKKKRRQKNN